ncbi:MAG: hypothetical protein JWQ55_6769 [Rhodopila sp.]|nr:hypothetical protein [Rhodopila sp.]
MWPGVRPGQSTGVAFFDKIRVLSHLPGIPVTAPYPPRSRNTPNNPA